METPDLSTDIAQVDMSTFLDCDKDQPACTALAESLKTFGAVLVKDPRVQGTDSDTFLDMMERYFSQPREDKLADARPQLFYQVGVTPDGVERPRDNSSIAQTMQRTEKPISDPSARIKDVKWRFFWRCGQRPEQTDFPELNAMQVIPKSFQGEWESTMNDWGHKLLNALYVVCEMLAIGLNLSRGCIQEKLNFGPHLLAPTGVDLNKYGHIPNTALAGYHYDLNLLTIHGRSRFPGLFIWTKDGKRLPVRVPYGYLLIQSGIQLEYLTAGVIQKGMHEVVVSEETIKATEKRKLENQGDQTKGIWRVSSTLFGHVRSDAYLNPLEHFAAQQNQQTNTSTTTNNNLKAGEQVAHELKALELA